jgi:hypothetical protein
VNASRIIAIDLLDKKLDYAFEVIGNSKTVEQAIEMACVA